MSMKQISNNEKMNKHLNKHRNKHKGFTLIELLVGMAILSLVLVLTAQFLIFIHNNFNRQTQNLDSTQQHRLAMQVVTEAVRKANLVTVTTSGAKIDSIDYELINHDLYIGGQKRFGPIDSFKLEKNADKVLISLGTLETEVFLR